METNRQKDIAEPKGANIIVKMFEWWNVAMLTPGGLTPEAFGVFYTDDAELIVNGNLRGQGLKVLANHYQVLQRDFESIQMKLPVLDEFSCGNRAFVKCTTRAIRDGDVITEEAMAAATVSGGKMSRLEVLGRRLD